MCIFQIQININKYQFIVGFDSGIIENFILLFLVDRKRFFI